MVSFFDASLKHLSIHHTGNKLLQEYFRLSDKPLKLEDELLRGILMQYFLKPFEKVNDSYRFYHPNNDLQLNEIFHFAAEVFSAQALFHDNSMQIAKHLYDVSSHPKIKSGELYVAFFENVQIEGEPLEAIGIFKSENKDTYLKVYPHDDGFGLSYEKEAISINKLDKGCLIFNIEKEEGFKVLVLDHSKSSSESAVYWKDEFLKLRIRNDNYNQTSNILGIYKNFVTEKLDDEYDISKADKIDLLNRSMKYFKENDTFNIEEFSTEVIGNQDGINSFKQYKNNYEQDYQTTVSDSFEIADAAVKKQARAYKSVLKLDKNFHIYIHGNKEMIERGYDQDKSLNYYKVYFREEE